MTDPMFDPERRAAQKKKAQSEVAAALHSLREDAAFAWKLAIGGDLSGLPAVDRAWRTLQAAVMAADRVNS